LAGRSGLGASASKIDGRRRGADGTAPCAAPSLTGAKIESGTWSKSDLRRVPSAEAERPGGAVTVASVSNELLWLLGFLSGLGELASLSLMR
jgi:hypothetical protein